MRAAFFENLVLEGSPGGENYDSVYRALWQRHAGKHKRADLAIDQGYLSARRQNNYE